jgi:hypothetical protein
MRASVRVNALSRAYAQTAQRPLLSVAAFFNGIGGKEMFKGYGARNAARS